MAHFDRKITQSLFFLSLVLHTNAIATPTQDTQDKYFVIRNQDSTGFVLDASDIKVKIQHFTGFASQLWKLEHVGLGKFLIVNKANGKVLDLETTGSPDRLHSALITQKNNDWQQQKWYINSDGTIANAYSGHVIDIINGYFKAGNGVQLYNKHGNPCQIFRLQEQ